jgi:acyl carrier protein
MSRHPQIEAKLQGFILGELLEEGFYDGGDPLAANAVDSLGVEQLVAYIEEEWGVPIGDEEMVAENFESIPALAALVDSKRGATA